jgi:transcriptional regulator with XRE-family HTH domain
MAQAIRRFRTILGDTQREFADRTRLTLTSIARYETNSRPSKTVLAKFAQIAQEANQPLFTDIFRGQAEPRPTEFEAQELSGAIQLLKSALDDLKTSRHGYRKAKLFVAFHLLSPGEYAEVERTLEKLVPASVVDEVLNRAGGDFVRARDPRVEKKRVEILRIAHQLVGTKLDDLVNEITRLANLRWFGDGQNIDFKGCEFAELSQNRTKNFKRKTQRADSKRK